MDFFNRDTKLAALKVVVVGTFHIHGKHEIHGSYQIHTKYEKHDKVMSTIQERFYDDLYIHRLAAKHSN